MRLRFTIRDLLWMTALLAMALGWSLDHRQIIKNANLESMILKDPTIVKLQTEIFELDAVRSIETANSIKPSKTNTTIDARISDRQREIDDRRNDLLHALP
jgi:hypothetical protein